MEQNVGGLDRTVRLVLGPLLVLVGLAAVVELLPLGMPIAAGALLVGLIFVVTGLTRTCVLNSLLGIDTSQR